MNRSCSSSVMRSLPRSLPIVLSTCWLTLFTYADPAIVNQLAAQLAGVAADRADGSTTDDDDETDAASFEVSTLAARRGGRSGNTPRFQASANGTHATRIPITALVSTPSISLSADVPHFLLGAGAFLRC